MGEIEYGVQVDAATPWKPILGGYDTRADAASDACDGDVVMVREIGAGGLAGEWREARRG